MAKPLDLAGKRFSRLLVVGRAGQAASGHFLWSYACDCGATGAAPGNAISSGRMQSCGCLKREVTGRLGKSATRHGMRNSPTYLTWRAMRARCTNAKSPDFQWYGARGITVCQRWDDFENFIADMGERPAGTSIDRIDVNGNYEPGNCRWATPVEQAQNKRNSRKDQHGL